MRRSILQGADFLVNISDYGWYGHSIASAQSLQMLAMRSLENQKPALRATNTGNTAIIGPEGGIHARLPQFQVAALDGVIQPMRGMTPYGRFRSWPALLRPFWPRRRYGEAGNQQAYAVGGCPEVVKRAISINAFAAAPHPPARCANATSVWVAFPSKGR